MRTCADYCDLLTPSPWYKGWGLIYQAGEPDDRVKLLQGPAVLISLNHDRDNANWIDHPRIVANITVGIPDDENGVLADAVLISLVEAGIEFLKRGINLLVHCAAGKSRSGYYTCALAMRALGLTYDDALRLVQRERPKVEPNCHFEAHLRRLQGRLTKAQDGS